MKLSVRDAAEQAGDQLALVCGPRVLTYRALAAAVRDRGVDGQTFGDWTLIRPRADFDGVVDVLSLIDRGRPFIALHPKWTDSECETALVGARPRASEGALACLFTSGSSGCPKGVVLTRENFLSAAAISARNLGWRDGDRWLLNLPLAHVGGLSVLTRCLAARRTITLAPRPGAIPQDATLLSLVPTQLERALSSWPQSTAVRAILLGGAPTPLSLLRRAREASLPVVPTYGLTEACSQVATATVDRSDMRALMDVRVEDEELWVRGPAVAREYIDGTPVVDDAGWLHTRDLGSVDANGVVRVYGRGDQMIVSGGENVHPIEVENALNTHGRVVENCVFGLPDPEWGQVVACALVAKDRIDEDEIHRHLEGRLARFKHPRRVFRLSELPRTSIGKIDRHRVRASCELG